MLGTTRRGLFGAPMQKTPGDFVEDTRTNVSSAPMAAALAPSTDVPAYTPKRTFLDKLGLVADAFSGNNNNANLLHEQDQQGFRQWRATAGQQLEDARRFAQFKQQKDYERDNPAPVNNDTVNDYNFFKATRGEDAANRFLDQAIQNGGAISPQIMTIPGMGVVQVNKGQPAAGGGGVPDGAVAMLKQNPAMSAQFDAKYGKGASARYLGQGGAAPQAQSPFPIR